MQPVHARALHKSGLTTPDLVVCASEATIALALAGNPKQPPAPKAGRRGAGRGRGGGGAAPAGPPPLVGVSAALRRAAGAMLVACQQHQATEAQGVGEGVSGWEEGEQQAAAHTRLASGAQQLPIQQQQRLQQQPEQSQQQQPPQQQAGAQDSRQAGAQDSRQGHLALEASVGAAGSASGGPAAGSSGAAGASAPAAQHAGGSGGGSGGGCRSSGAGHRGSGGGSKRAAGQPLILQGQARVQRLGPGSPAQQLQATLANWQQHLRFGWALVPRTPAARQLPGAGPSPAAAEAGEQLALVQLLTQRQPAYLAVSWSDREVVVFDLQPLLPPATHVRQPLQQCSSSAGNIGGASTSASASASASSKPAHALAPALQGGAYAAQLGAALHAVFGRSGVVGACWDACGALALLQQLLVCTGPATGAGALAAAVEDARSAFRLWQPAGAAAGAGGDGDELRQATAVVLPGHRLQMPPLQDPDAALAARQALLSRALMLTLRSLLQRPQQGGQQQQQATAGQLDALPPQLSLWSAFQRVEAPLLSAQAAAQAAGLTFSLAAAGQLLAGCCWAMGQLQQLVAQLLPRQRPPRLGVDADVAAWLQGMGLAGKRCNPAPGSLPALLERAACAVARDSQRPAWQLHAVQQMLTHARLQHLASALQQAAALQALAGPGAAAVQLHATPGTAHACPASASLISGLPSGWDVALLPCSCPAQPLQFSAVSLQDEASLAGGGALLSPLRAPLAVVLLLPPRPAAAAPAVPLQASSSLPAAAATGGQPAPPAAAVYGVGLLVDTRQQPRGRGGASQLGPAGGQQGVVRCWDPGVPWRVVEHVQACASMWRVLDGARSGGAQGPVADAGGGRVTTQPGALSLRRCLVAPPGRALVGCVFHALPLQALAWLSGDAALLAACCADEPYAAAAATWAAAAEQLPQQARPPLQQLARCLEDVTGSAGSSPGAAPAALLVRVLQALAEGSSPERLADAACTDAKHAGLLTASLGVAFPGVVALQERSVAEAARSG